MKNTNRNPNTLKKKLASGFLKKLNKIVSSASMAEKGKRQHAVRAAAYAAMASAVGPRRAWSRAILRKIRNQKRPASARRKRTSNKGTTRFEHEEILNHLSEMVPGGQAMDSCSLLNETTHYIKCLRAQVQIMTQILHFSSSSSS